MDDLARDPSPDSATAVPTPVRQAGGSVTIARNSLWLMVDSLAAFIASFYCSIWVARGLGPDLMGQYNFVLYFVTFLRMVSEVAIPATLRKFTAECVGRGDYGTVRTLVRRGRWLLARLSGLAVLAGLAIVLVLFSPEHRLVAALAVLSILPAALLSTATGALAATENLRHNVVASLVSIATNVLGVTISLLMGWGLVGLTASLLISRVVDCCLRFSIYRRVYAQLPGSPPRGSIDPSLRERMIRFAAHQVLLVLLYTFLFDRMEVFFLKSLAPSREIAFFSISFTLVSYLLQIPMNLAGAAQASAWVQQGRAPEEAVRTTATATWFVLLLAAPALLGVAALSDPLLRLVYGTKYLPAIPVLTVLGIMSLGLAVSQPTQFLLVGAERQRFYIVWLCIAAVVDVAGNFLLVPTYGAVGAAFAKGAAGAFGATGFLAYLVVHFRAKLPYARMAKLLAACIVMFAGVRLVIRPLPPLLALLLGIPIGAAIFLVLTRWLRLLDELDRRRLTQLERLVPWPVRPVYFALVDFLVPA